MQTEKLRANGRASARLGLRGGSAFAAVSFGFALSLLACGGTPAPAPVEPESPPPAEGAVMLSGAPAPPIFVRGIGLARPHTAAYDDARDEYLVSNVQGLAGAADGDGFISRFAPDGTLVDLKFIQGGEGGAVLNAPKGMAIAGETLFVADLNVVRRFDRSSGSYQGQVAIVAATYLNAVSAGPEGRLYVSDSGWQTKGTELEPSGKDAIYAVDAAGGASVLAEGPALGQPCGLLADASGVWVVNQRGQLFHVDHDGTLGPPVSLPGQRLEGVARTGAGRFLVSSWDRTTVFVSHSAAPQAGFEAFITDLQSPGGLGYDPRRRAVLIPLFEQDAFYVQEVPGG